MSDLLTAERQQSGERFFIAKPTATDRKAPNSNGAMYPVYEHGSEDLKWSNSLPLPEIGADVRVLINSLGLGTVVGYCASHGWLGVMVNLEDAPEWYKRQTGQRLEETARARKLGPEKAQLERIREWPDWICSGVAVAFGAEITL